MAGFTHNGIIYTDDVFHQQGKPQYSYRHGLNQVSVSFRGPTPKAQIFSDNLNLRIFPAIVKFGAPIDLENFTGYDSDDDPIFTTFRLYFDVGNIVYPQMYVDDLRLMTTTLTGIFYPPGYDPETGQLPGQIQATIQVRCPATTWTWFENTRPNPNEPRHKTVNSTATPWQNVVLSSSFISRFGGTYVEEIFNAFKEILQEYEGGVEETWDNYTVEELIPGKFWACSCTAIRQPASEGAIITAQLEE